MDTGAHHVKPESLSVEIYEYENFFSVSIGFRCVETHYEPYEPDGDSLSSDADLEALEENFVEVLAELSHTHKLFIGKDEKYSLPRDEILMKLKLAFPNHTYELVESD